MESRAVQLQCSYAEHEDILKLLKMLVSFRVE